jgi:hypothetical protein
MGRPCVEGKAKTAFPPGRVKWLKLRKNQCFKLNYGTGRDFGSGGRWNYRQ